MLYKKIGFTLIELIIVIIIIAILTTLGTSYYLKLMISKNSEISLEYISSFIDKKNIETILSSSDYFNINFNKGLGVYYYNVGYVKENYIGDILLNDISYSGSNLYLSFLLDNSNNSGSYKMNKEIGDNIFFSELTISGNLLTNSNMDFLKLNKQDLLKTTFYITDSEGNILSPKTKLAINSNNLELKDLIIYDIKGKDYNNSILSYDRLKITFLKTGKKNLYGYLGENKYFLKSSQLIFINKNGELYSLDIN